MQLKAPIKSPDFSSVYIFGKHFQLSDYLGKRVVLSFFRDAACPFCNYRVYELTHKYKGWKDAGVEVVVVFSDSSEKVRTHVARHPRPFRMLSDPNLKLYDLYGVEKSFMALVKAVLFKLPEVLRGISKGGRPSSNPHLRLVPADFLIDVDGRVVELHYGKNTADHIPIEKIQQFATRRNPLTPRREIEAELLALKKENAKLKQK